MNTKIEENNVINFVSKNNSNNSSTNNIKINKDNIHSNAKDNNDIINKSKNDKNNESYISNFVIKKESNEQNMSNSVNESKLSIPFNTFFEIDLSFYSLDYNYKNLSSHKSTLKELIYMVLLAILIIKIF